MFESRFVICFVVQKRDQIMSNLHRNDFDAYLSKDEECEAKCHYNHRSWTKFNTLSILLCHFHVLNFMHMIENNYMDACANSCIVVLKENSTNCMEISCSFT